MRKLFCSFFREKGECRAHAPAYAYLTHRWVGLELAPHARLEVGVDAPALVVGVLAPVVDAVGAALFGLHQVSAGAAPPDGHKLPVHGAAERRHANLVGEPPEAPAAVVHPGVEVPLVLRLQPRVRPTHVQVGAVLAPHLVFLLGHGTLRTFAIVRLSRPVLDCQNKELFHIFI